MTVLSMGRAGTGSRTPFRSAARVVSRLGAYLAFAQCMKDVSQASPELRRETLDRALRRLDETLQRD